MTDLVERGAVDIRVLGPLEVVGGDGRPRETGTPKQRKLLSILALAEGRPVTPATLIDRIWGDAPPAEAHASLQVYVSNLRRVLEPERRPRAQSRLLPYDPAGYRLAVEPSRLDAARFLALVAEAEQATDPVAVERAATRALRLWRGDPYSDLAGQDYLTASLAHLTEARERVRELRVSALIGRHRHHEVVGELEALTHEHPLRERLWALRALALYRCGRQGEALDALRTAGRILADELGVDLGDELRDLQRDILRQAPHLRPARVRPVAAPAVVRVASRHAELTALAHLLDESAGGRPQFALITGEPGIGKTHLAGEMADRAGERGHLVVLARCAATSGTPAFWPWTQVLRQLSRLTPEGTDVGAGETTPFAAGESTAQALATAARERPILVILDDLHWADPASLRLLSHLAQTFADGRVTIVATARDSEAAAQASSHVLNSAHGPALHPTLNPAQNFALNPAPNPAPNPALFDAYEALARRRVLRLSLIGLTLPELAQLAPAGMPRDEVRVLRDRSGGNPFFATELLRHRGGGLPPGVRDVVSGRVGRLPAPAADLLPVAAAAGGEFDVARVARVAGLSLETAIDRMEAAMAAGLLVERSPGRFGFVHGVVREALTEGRSALRRAVGHDPKAGHQPAIRRPGVTPPGRLCGRSRIGHP